MSIKSTLEGSSRQPPAPPVVAPKEKIPLSTHLIAGGIAGLAEALAWYVPTHPSAAFCFARTRRRHLLMCSHPLDTIKVRMQLSRSRKMRGVSPVTLKLDSDLCMEGWTNDQLKPLGFFATGKQIAARETPLGLYKGLGAVVSGIVPKMAIRFASFERQSSSFLPHHM